MGVLPRKRRPLVLLLLTATTMMVALIALLAPGHLERLRYAATEDGCAHVPIAPAVTPLTHPDSRRWPYGAVYACRELDGWANLLGEPDVSFVLLLDTDTGAVLTRMDYYDIDAGRQFVAQAIELQPDGISGLTASESARINDAIATRGGLLLEPWIVNYGDG